MLQILECPRRFVGSELADAINIAGMCSSGHLPVSGGIMNQSAWFISLWQQLQSEQSMIEAEQAERVRNG